MNKIREKADLIREYRCKNLIAVIEDPKTPKNLGTVLRNVNALGVEKAYVVDSSNSIPDNWEDIREWNPLLKSSASAVKWTFVKKFSSTVDCIAHLNENKFISAVTSPHIQGKENVDLSDGDYTQKRLAVWFGNETRGVSDEAIEHSEFCINIPMYGIIESLNLGTSSGIVLYEVTRQRRKFVENKYGVDLSESPNKAIKK